MSAELQFDSLDPVSIPVAIAGRSLVLREITEIDHATYNAAMMRLIDIKGVKKKDDVKVDITPDMSEGMARLDRLFLSLCLWEEDRRAVTMDELATWPHRIVSALLDRAKAISGMGEKEGASKNEPSATTGPSA